MWHALEPGEVHARFWSGDLSKTNQLENLSVDGRIILKCILKSVRVADWIDVTQNREKLQALVNAVMNFRVP
jgi:hypothetical protein